MAEAELTERQRYWFDHLKVAEEREIALAGYAAEQGLKTKDLYNWKSQFIKRGLMVSSVRATDFVPVEIAASARCYVHLPNGVRVEFSVPMSGQTIREVLIAASGLA